MAAAPAEVTIRLLREGDIAALKHLHNIIFPIDYDDSFFLQAVAQDGIVGWAAVVPPQSLAAERLPDDTTVLVDGEQLVGFITIKDFRAAEVPPPDRLLMGFDNAALDAAQLTYILTLAVVPVRLLCPSFSLFY